MAPRSLGRAAPALAALVALAGCADLPRIDSGVCGNAVIDVGEDCDTHVDDALGPGTSCAPASDTARACRYVCSEATPCPLGWGCGEGGVCRFASGEFRTLPPVRLAAERLDVADYDGDGHLDLLGASGARLELAYGTGDGAFPALGSTVTAFPTGPLGLGELSGDARGDVVVPTTDGLFVLTGSAARTLDPIAYAAIPIPVGELPLQVFPVKAQDTSPFETPLLMLSSCMSFQFEGTDLLGCNEPATKFPEIPGPPAGDRFTADQLVGRIARGNLDGALSPDEELALTPATGDALSSRTVYLMRPKLVETAPPGPCRCPGGDAECTLAGNVEVRCVPTLESFGQVVVTENILFGARFADYEGDGDLDLFVSTGTVGDDHVAVALNNGAGSFAALDGTPNVAKTDAIFDALAFVPADTTGGGAGVVGAPQRWPLAIGSFNPDVDAAADFVGQYGVYIRFGGFVFQTYVNTNLAPWSEAEAADFNRDGITDIAIALRDSDGIDFLGGVGNGLFNPAHLDTVDVPFALRSGDFDGDLVTDLAFGEHGVLSGRGDDSLSVCFGNLQGPPAPPISMGRLGTIDFMEPTRIITSVSNIDMISDLLVQSTQEGGGRTLAALIGSAQRRLLSPLTLQPVAGKQDDVPIAVLTGAFDAAAGNDLLVLAPPRLWLLSGAPDAQFDSTMAQEIELAALLGGVGAESFNAFCTVGVAGDVNHDEFDDVVVLDNNARCFGQGNSPPPIVVVLARDADGDPKPFTIELDELDGTLVAPRSVRLADLDADGHNDLIVVFEGDRSFGGGVGGLPEKAGVAVFWGDGTSFDLAAPARVPVLADDPTPFAAAVAINADADKEPELAVATSLGVYVLDVSGREIAPPATGAPTVTPGGRALEAVDVDGDGLADLLLLDDAGAQVYVFSAVASTSDAPVAGGRP